MAEAKVKKRNPNWSKLESNQLVEEILARNHIIKAHHSILSNAEIKKRSAWEEIANAVSAVSPHRRNVEDCRQKYTNLTKDATKKISEYNKKLKMTGMYILYLLTLKI